MQQNLAAVRELSSASPSVVHPRESTSITKKKKKAKFELASLVAKDLEELNRKRAVKQEPVEEADSLLEMPFSNGVPVFTSSSHREVSMDSSSVRLTDINSCDVQSMDTSGNTNPDSLSAMETETDHADSPPLDSGITPVCFPGV
jgi:hypothetical protein